MIQPVVLAAALVPALALPALAQEALFLPERSDVLVRDHGGMEVSIGVVGRLSAMDGELDPDVPVDYADLFGTGVGYAIEAALLFDGGYGWGVGPYLSIGSDRFEGERDTDPFGDSLDADDLYATTLLVGGKGVFPFSPHWHVEAHAALGAVHYYRTDGVLTLSGVDSEVTIFRASTTIAFDMGSRIGFRVEQFFGELGFGIRVQGAPSDGDLDFSSSGPAQIALEFSLGLRF